MPLDDTQILPNQSGELKQTNIPSAIVSQESENLTVVEALKQRLEIEEILKDSFTYHEASSILGIKEEVEGSTIRGLKRRHSTSLLEFHHWIREDQGKDKGKVKWTPRGIIRLAFLIKPNEITKNFMYEVESIFLEYCEDFKVTPVSILRKLQSKKVEGEYSKVKQELDLIQGSIDKKKCIECGREIDSLASIDRGMGELCWRNHNANGTSFSSLPDVGPTTDTLPISSSPESTLSVETEPENNSELVIKKTYTPASYGYVCDGEGCGNHYKKSNWSSRKSSDRCPVCIRTLKPKSELIASK